MTPEERAELHEWLSHPGDPEGNAPLTRREARDLLADLDAAEAERDLLESGRCLADITHRDEGHRQSVCMLPKDHAPLVHDDCLGCTWSDANHWEPSAVDALAAAVERVRALHNRQPSRLTGDYCAADGDDYPCPTLRALDGGE